MKKGEQGFSSILGGLSRSRKGSSRGGYSVEIATPGLFDQADTKALRDFLKHIIKTDREIRFKN
ncbi:MAG: hypothetical protein H0T78_12760 [Longispora sp.]|nr:hypothetical protein [Longispora sp. (in: high G+C Gram-positive bacteria)]